MNRFITIYMIVLIWATPGISQYQFNNASLLTTENGLPTNLTIDVAEDHYGFIWIGTRNGLVRFDGSKVIPLEEIGDGASSLPSRFIYSLLVSGDSLWIGHQKGLSVLDLNSGAIYNHEFQLEHLKKKQDAASLENMELVWDIIEDRDRNIWMSPSHAGFVKWDRKTGAFSIFPISPDDIQLASYSQRDQTTLVRIAQDVKADSIFWGVGLGGIVRMNVENGTYERILYPKGTEGLQYDINRKTCFYQDSTGILYTGSWGGGLSIYNPHSKVYFYPRQDFESTFKKVGGRDHLLTITPGKPGHLYLTFSSGLYDYNILEERVSIIKKHIRKSENNRMYGTKFTDSKGRIWYPHGFGVLLFDPMVHQYRWFDLGKLNPTEDKAIIRNVVEDFYPGYVTIGGQYIDGIYHYNLETGHAFKHEYLSQLEGEAYFHTGGLGKLNDSTLILSTKTKLYTLNKSHDKISELAFKNTFQFNDFSYLFVGEDQTVWIGSSRQGLLKLDLASMQITPFTNDPDLEKSGLIFQDKDYNIWSITGSGHNFYNIKNGYYYHFDYNQDSTNTFLVSRNFCECPNGEIWLSGRENGIGLVSKMAPQKGVLRKIIPKNAQNKPVTIHKIACSPNNELWAIGDDGLMKINRQTFRTTTHSFAYGAKNWFHYFRFLKNGDLFLGSRDGFYTVSPEELITNQETPRPYVNKVSSNLGIKGSIEGHLHQVPIYLSAKEPLLTIDFSAINHTLPEQTKFLYRLEGLDDNWIDPGEDRSLLYSYLPGGNYVFQLKACNNEGVWSEEVYELPIRIATPWYKSVVFISTCIFIALMLIYAFYRFRIRQLRRENELKSKFEKRVAGLEMSALRAQMNPHFVFNCLNSIEAYIIRNDTHKASEYLNTFGRLVRLILQNSRNAYISLHDEIESLKLYIQLEQMRFKDNFSYEILVADDIDLEVYEIPPMLLQPFVENAIWHGLNHRESGGTLKIEVLTDSENLICIIEDNGIGRIAAGKIRAAQKIKRKSMGMGITMERIDTLNKAYQTKNEIKIKDLYASDGKAAGTRVTVIIPL